MTRRSTATSMPHFDLGPWRTCRRRTLGGRWSYEPPWGSRSGGWERPDGVMDAAVLTLVPFGITTRTNGFPPGYYSTGSGSAPPIGMPWLSMRE